MWREKIILGILLLISIGISCQSYHKDFNPQFKRDINHSGVFPEKSTTGTPSVKWSFKTNGRIFSSPIVYGGAVYIGSDDSCLYAINSDEGTIKWKFKTDGRVRSTPAVYDETVYFLSYDGIFYALDAATGKKRWTFKTKGERAYAAPGIHGLLPADQMITDDWDVYLSSPAVADSHVYFGSSDGNVYALDAKNGAELWHFTTHGIVHSSPAVNSGMVFIGSWDRNMYALDATTGQEKWHFTTGNDTVYHNQIGIQGSPLISDSLLYFGCRDSHIYALNKYTGRMRWNFNAKGSWVIVTPTMYEGKLYAATSDSHRFLVLDPLTGKVLSENDTKTYVFGSPVATQGTIYIPTFGGLLMAFNASSANLVWVWKTDAAKKNYRNALDDEGRYHSNIFFSRNASDTPVEMNRIYSVGSILSTPWIQGGKIYIGSTDSTLYALE